MNDWATKCVDETRKLKEGLTDETISKLKTLLQAEFGRKPLTPASLKSTAHELIATMDPMYTKIEQEENAD